MSLLHIALYCGKGGYWIRRAATGIFIRCCTSYTAYLLPIEEDSSNVEASNQYGSLSLPDSCLAGEDKYRLAT
jgi:hypothetical protein